MNFPTVYSRSVKSAIGILIGIAVNLWITVVNRVIFTILNLATPEHRKPFCSSTSFFSVFSFPLQRSLTSLVKFIPLYFSFEAVMKDLFS